MLSLSLISYILLNWEENTSDMILRALDFGVRQLITSLTLSAQYRDWLDVISIKELKRFRYVVSSKRSHICRRCTLQYDVNYDTMSICSRVVSLIFNRSIIRKNKITYPIEFITNGACLRRKILMSNENVVSSWQVVITLSSSIILKDKFPIRKLQSEGFFRSYRCSLKSISRKYTISLDIKNVINDDVSGRILLYGDSDRLWSIHLYRENDHKNEI